MKIKNRVIKDADGNVIVDLSDGPSVGGFYVGVLAVLKDIVEAVDPTGISDAKEGGQMLGEAIQPWVDDNNGGNWQTGVDGLSYKRLNQAAMEGW